MKQSSSNENSTMGIVFFFNSIYELQFFVKISKWRIFKWCKDNISQSIKIWSKELSQLPRKVPSRNISLMLMELTNINGYKLFKENCVNETQHQRSSGSFHCEEMCCCICEKNQVHYLCTFYLENVIVETGGFCKHYCAR